MLALYIGLGGFLGTLLRYIASLLIRPESGFPLATLFVNVVGCFFIGCVYFWNQTHGTNSPYPLIITTGILGGFTTFSAFGLETFRLIDQNQFALALTNVFANVVLGLLAIFLAKFIFNYV